jgi:hypothetical protein
MKLKIVACLFIGILFITSNKATAQDTTLRWSQEKAWKWHNPQPWYCGFNYIPAYAINYTAMWDKTTFDLSAIDKELALAQASGMNVLRAVLQYAVYADDPAYFLKTLDSFMGVCATHHIKFVPALFDDCVFGITFEPKVGKQSEPLKGWYAWDWSPSPGHSMVIDSATHHALERYVTAVMTRFKKDSRILFWDLYNEPTNGGLGSATFPLLKKVIACARKVNPSQPVSIDVWNNNRRLNDIALAGSDIISFHNYGNKDVLQQQITDLKKYNRPIICTEWMNRANRSVISDNLPVFYNEKVGCMLWGLVNGKTQTDLPWGHRPGDPPPAVWQHDLYKPDLSPYQQPEIDSIKMYTMKKLQ